MASSGEAIGVVDRQSERAEREPDAGDVHLALRAQSRGDHDAEEQEGSGRLSWVIGRACCANRKKSLPREADFRRLKRKTNSLR